MRGDADNCRLLNTIYSISRTHIPQVCLVNDFGGPEWSKV